MRKFNEFRMLNEAANVTCPFCHKSFDAQQAQQQPQAQAQPQPGGATFKSIWETIMKLPLSIKDGYNNQLSTLRQHFDFSIFPKLAPALYQMAELFNKHLQLMKQGIPGKQAREQLHKEYAALASSPAFSQYNGGAIKRLCEIGFPPGHEFFKEFIKEDPVDFNLVSNAILNNKIDKVEHHVKNIKIIADSWARTKP